jgi:hypothetical protein
MWHSGKQTGLRHIMALTTEKTIKIPEIGEVCLKRHRRARRVKVRVGPDLRVEVTMPWRLAQKHAEAFVISCSAWIDAKRRQLESDKEYHAGLLDRTDISRLEAAERLKTLLSELARKHGFTYNQVSVRGQKARWGSCSGRNNISLNYKLIYLPAHLQEYVLLHELVHTIHKNHSKRFWQRLKTVCPRLDELRRELRRYDPRLLE